MQSGLICGSFQRCDAEQFWDCSARVCRLPDKLKNEFIETASMLFIFAIYSGYGGPQVKGFDFAAFGVLLWLMK